MLFEAKVFEDFGRRTIEAGECHIADVADFAGAVISRVVAAHSEITERGEERGSG